MQSPQLARPNPSARRLMLPKDESNLLIGLSRGDAGPFWQFWSKNRNYLLSLCMHWLGGNRDDAEDVLSRSALKVIDRLWAKPIHVRKFRPWLVRSLRNTCFDILRERRRIHIRLLPSQPVDESPDRAVDRLKLGFALKRSVTKLPPTMRDTFVLRFVDDLPYQEIARRLNISPDNARKRIQQARERLRRDLARFHGR